MADKNISVRIEKLQEMQNTLEENLNVITQARADIANLLQRLINADWRNHDSRRFERHYKSGEEAVTQDLNDLTECVTDRLKAAISEYESLYAEVEEYYNDSFWKSS